MMMIKYLSLREQLKTFSHQSTVVLFCVVILLQTILT